MSWECVLGRKERWLDATCFVFSEFLLYLLDFVAVCLGLYCCEILWPCFNLQVVVPPELGYGDTGAPPDIPPNAVLVFELDLIKIDQRAEL